MTTSEGVGVLAAMLSSMLGGTAAAITRYMIGAVDPVTLAALRFGIGFLLILPIALALRSKWPQGRDWIAVAGLGVLFFAVFFYVYNVAISYTTAARGALALSTLPLTTMLVAALLGIEQLTRRKTVGVLVALGGVATALATGLADAPVGAWRGDMLMVSGTLLMALYNVWSRPIVLRSSRLGFLAAGMGFGSATSALLAWHTGGWVVTQSFGVNAWMAASCLGVFGGAAAFYLWVFALERTTPTRVANTMTLNPVAASLLAAVLVGEPIGINLLVGIAAVGIGIWIASTDGRPR